jgi:hypothetical protein
MSRSRSVDRDARGRAHARGSVRALKLGGVALLAALAPVTLGGCTADSVSLRITCNVVPEGDCTYTEGGLCLLQGTLNLGAGTGSYSSVLRVTNGLKSRESDIPPQSEPNGVQITELEIHLTDSAGREPTFARSLPNPYTVPATGTAEPGDEALVGAELLPSAYIAQIAALQRTSRALGSIRLSIIARGTSWGEVEVESGEWRWNIRLVDYSIDPADGQCIPFEDEVCGVGQDGAAFACNPALVTET